MPGFAEVLKGYRAGSGMSQRALARAAKINPAIVNRLESGDRAPSGPEQVRALARGLNLDAEQSDRLLGAAGYWPDAFRSLGPLDHTLLRVARLLANPQLAKADQARFRQVIDLLVDQWLGLGQPSNAEQPGTIAD
jgi:transcriptional regulator with XRE-family HTH domain